MPVKKKIPPKISRVKKGKKKVNNKFKFFEDVKIPKNFKVPKWLKLKNFGYLISVFGVAPVLLLIDTFSGTDLYSLFNIPFIQPLINKIAEKVGRKFLLLSSYPENLKEMDEKQISEGFENYFALLRRLSKVVGKPPEEANREISEVIQIVLKQDNIELREV